MEIKNYAGMISAYQKAGNADYTARKSVQQPASAGKNTDKVEFSAETLKLREAESAVVEELRNDASPERIAELRGQIAQGKYHIGDDALAKALAGSFYAEG